LITRTTNSTLFPYTTLFRSVIKGFERALSKTSSVANIKQLNKILVILKSFLSWFKDKLPFLNQRSKTNSPSKPKVKDKFLFPNRSEEHTSELQSRENLVCRL